MSTKSQIAALAAVAIVIAAPAFAGQRLKPTRGFAGAFASSDDPSGTHVNPVQRPANNNLNGVASPAHCLDFGIDLDLPTRCWGHGL